MRFTGAVVKVASRCNLNCSYCYVYNLGDETWRDKPATMSRKTIQQLVWRVAEHCEAHGLTSFTYCLHGGEPLLMPQDRLRFFVEAAHGTMPSGCEAQFLMQTNGVLLTPAWCESLKALNVKIGVSLDGTEARNDRFRVDHKGRGSFADVITGLNTAAAAGLDYGILSVIDVEADPEESYRHLASLKPRAVDLLLPDATYDRPPLRIDDAVAPYGDWLIRFFRCWSADPHPLFRVRRFDQILDIALGLVPPLSETDMHRNEILVVETDGALEPMDILKGCAPGMTKSRYNLHDHSLDTAAKHPLIRAYYKAREAPCPACAECPVLDFCGGGYFPHRYQRQSGFANPSVYCHDLYAVVREVQSWALAQLPKTLVKQLGIEPVV
jgi:uncharacterized protein